MNLRIFSAWTFLVFFSAFLLGCALRQYDAMSADEIERTIDFEREDYALTLKALEDGKLDDLERRSLETRHESELARLRAWLMAESAKQP